MIMYLIPFKTVLLNTNFSKCDYKKTQRCVIEIIESKFKFYKKLNNLLQHQQSAHSHFILWLMKILVKFGGFSYILTHLCLRMPPQELRRLLGHCR